SPIPDLKEVETDTDQIFIFPREIVGIELNEHEQLELLERFRPWYNEQPFPSTKAPNRRFFFENANYGYADAIALYWMMRLAQPKRIVEVGSGFSSCAMLDVNDVVFNGSIACTCIDPYPELLRSLLWDSDVDRVRIIGKRVQEVDPSVFKELEPGDIL